MKISLRTLLIIVITITSLSVIFQKIMVQVVLSLIALLLLFLINPHKKRFYRLAHRMKHILFIISVLMILQILFRREGDVLWQWNFIKITSVGFEYGIIISLRLFLIIIIAGLLFDIPYYDYLLAFQAWKFPQQLTFLIPTSIHFLRIFTKQFTRVKEALKLRGIDLSKLYIAKRVSAYTSLVFPILASTLEKIQYRAISLELRGFGLYKNRTFLYKKKLQWFDYVIQISCLFIFLGILIFGYI